MFKNIIAHIIKNRWFPAPVLQKPLICDTCGKKLENVVLNANVISSNKNPTIDKVDEDDFFSSYSQYEF
jgi:hypothetical protein